MSKVTYQWEDGKFVCYVQECTDKADAFRRLDETMRDAKYPASIHAVISEDGEVVWSQMGTHVEVNR